jgi:hypothetical protein
VTLEYERPGSRFAAIRLALTELARRAAEPDVAPGGDDVFTAHLTDMVASLPDRESARQ